MNANDGIKSISSNPITAKCPLCKTMKKVSLLYIIKNHRHAGKEVYTYVQCNKCQLAFLNPMPTREELDSVYTEIYDLYEAQENTFQDKIAHLLSQPRDEYIMSVRKSPGRILDVGCGIGTFLKKMGMRGWITHGVETSKWAADEAKKKIGQDKIFISQLNQCGFPDEYFDIVTLWHVLEHVDDPLGLIEEIHRILKKKGALVIEVPSLDSFCLKLFKESYSSLFVPEHLFYWSKNSLEILLKRGRFSIKKLDYPLVIPLTFSKNLSHCFQNNLAAKFIFLSSFPTSMIISGIGSKRGTGEFLRLVAIKENELRY
jgi:2-polyprenyl-3-methyl-5-hydroxy-6-metoxy-1,4-benzoquinol methylase